MYAPDVSIDCAQGSVAKRTCRKGQDGFYDWFAECVMQSCDAQCGSPPPSMRCADGSTITYACGPAQQGAVCSWHATSTCMPPKLASSLWGGSGIQLTIGNGGGALLFDCGNGTLDAPIVLAADGTFSVPGTYTQGSGVVVMNPPKPVPVTYTGSVNGNTMHLSFVVDGVTRTFDLTANSMGMLAFCA
jgi:hypothetical protein